MTKNTRDTLLRQIDNMYGTWETVRSNFVAATSALERYDDPVISEVNANLIALEVCLQEIAEGLNGLEYE